MKEAFEWHAQVKPLCPRWHEEPDVCDCGYEGDWQMRYWTEKQTCPPTFAFFASREVFKRCNDCKRGGEGHDCIAGYEERCPRCGDVERFTMDGELVESSRNPDGPGFFVKELHPNG